MGARFARSLRLNKKADFSAVFGFRCVVRSTHFSVFAKPNALLFSRLGMSITRRVAPLAVDRNYMKRVIREVFRRHQQDFIGVDVVVSPRLAFAGGKYFCIEAELVAALAETRKKCLASSRA